jgi:hypothetical protein
LQTGLPWFSWVGIGLGLQLDVPENSLTATATDEGVPHNLATALQPTKGFC